MDLADRWQMPVFELMNRISTVELDLWAARYEMLKEREELADAIRQAQKIASKHGG